MPSVIALDAMGSDRAPKPEIEGAIQAARLYGVRVILIGPEPVLRAELDRHLSARLLPIEIQHASEVITMEDKAVAAVRAKRDSSMRVGLRMVRDGRAHGFITAGNTGASIAQRCARCFPRQPARQPHCSMWAPTSTASRITWNSLR